MEYNTIISVKEAQALLDTENCRFIDCRFMLTDKSGGEKLYQTAHIPGAVYAHLNRDLSGKIIPGETGRHPLPDPEAMAERIGKWGIDSETQVIVYDQSHGGIAARLWWLLRWLGHEKVAVLDGGWAAWQKANAPVSDAAVHIEEKTFTANLQGHLAVGVETIATYYDDEDFCLIDARASERYRGEEEPIDPVAGHIPSALNLPYMENLNGDGLWKSPEELKERFADVGEKGPVFYCGSGVTACHNILAIKHAGLGDARLYAGSWSDWILDEEREVAKEVD